MGNWPPNKEMRSTGEMSEAKEREKAEWAAELERRERDRSARERADLGRITRLALLAGCPPDAPPIFWLKQKRLIHNGTAGFMFSPRAEKLLKS
jgi:hypothetical protein